MNEAGSGGADQAAVATPNQLVTSSATGRRTLDMALPQLEFQALASATQPLSGFEAPA